MRATFPVLAGTFCEYVLVAVLLVLACSLDRVRTSTAAQL